MRRSRILVLTTVAFGIGAALHTSRSPGSADDVFQNGRASSTQIPERERNFRLRVRVGPSDILLDNAFSARVVFHDKCHIEARFDKDHDFHLSGDVQIIDNKSANLTYEARLRSNDQSLRATGNVLLKVNSSQPTVLQLGDLTLHVWLK